MRRPTASASGARPLLLTVLAWLGLAALTQSWRFAWVVAAFVALYLGAEWAAGREVHVRLAAALPGAAVLAWRMWPARQEWARWAVFAVVMVAALAVPDLDRRWAGTGATGLVGALAASGIYACVPETGHLRAVALAFGVVAAADLLAGTRTGPGLAVAGAALLGWAVVYGGTYREGALVGGFAAIGLLLAEPVAVRLPGPRRALVGRNTTIRLGALLALQAGFALLVARTAGLRDEARPALAVAVPMAAGLLVVTRLALGPVRRTAR